MRPKCRRHAVNIIQRPAGLAHGWPHPLRLHAGGTPAPEPAQGARGQEAPPRAGPAAGSDRADGLRGLLPARLGAGRDLRQAQPRSRPLPAAAAQPQGRDGPPADLEPFAGPGDAPQPQVHRLQRLGAARQAPWPALPAPPRAMGSGAHTGPRADRAEGALRHGRRASAPSRDPGEEDPGRLPAAARAPQRPIRPAARPSSLRIVRPADGGQLQEGLTLVSLPLQGEPP
jgi:hypothetical protein